MKSFKLRGFEFFLHRKLYLNDFLANEDHVNKIYRFLPRQDLYLSLNNIKADDPIYYINSIDFIFFPDSICSTTWVNTYRVSNLEDISHSHYELKRTSFIINDFDYFDRKISLQQSLS